MTLKKYLIKKYGINKLISLGYYFVIDCENCPIKEYCLLDRRICSAEVENNLNRKMKF